MTKRRTSAAALLRSAEALLSQGREAAAIKVLEGVLELEPEHAEALQLLASLRRWKERLVEARELLTTGEVERAVALIEQLLDENPDHTEALELLSQAHRGSARQDDTGWKPDSESVRFSVDPLSETVDLAADPPPAEPPPEALPRDQTVQVQQSQFPEVALSAAEPIALGPPDPGPKAAVDRERPEDSLAPELAELLRRLEAVRKSVPPPTSRQISRPRAIPGAPVQTAATGPPTEIPPPSASRSSVPRERPSPVRQRGRHLPVALTASAALVITLSVWVAINTLKDSGQSPEASKPSVAPDPPTSPPAPPAAAEEPAINTNSVSPPTVDEGTVPAGTSVAVIEPPTFEDTTTPVSISEPPEITAVVPTVTKELEKPRVSSPPVLTADLVPAEGYLELDVSPWAEIREVVEVRSGRRLDLDGPLYTPQRLTLPAGEYRITLRHPNFGESVCPVAVAADLSTVKDCTFAATSLSAALEELGL